MGKTHKSVRDVDLPHKCQNPEVENLEPLP